MPEEIIQARVDVTLVLERSLNFNSRSIAVRRVVASATHPYAGDPAMNSTIAVTMLNIAVTPALKNAIVFFLISVCLLVPLYIFMILHHG